MKKLLKIIKYLLIAFLVWVILWVLTFLTPMGRITGPIVMSVTFPMHMSVKYEVTPLVYILSFTPFKNQRMPYLKGGCSTPLQWAIREGSIKTTKILLDREANFSTCSRNTILHRSVSKPELLKYLIEERGIDPMLIDDTNKKATSRYISLGDRIRGNSNKGEYPIFSAMYCNQEELQSKGIPHPLKIFFNNGVDPNIKSRSATYEKMFGKPVPLLARAAIHKGCSFILDAGADPIAADKALREYFKRRKPYNKNSMYSFNMEEATSEIIKENIRLIKRASEKAQEKISDKAKYGK